MQEVARSRSKFDANQQFFTPDASCTWLISELDPDDPDIAFGLCDLGMGFPELGSVRISELERVRGKLGLPVERDRYFAPYKTLSAYADEARVLICIQIWAKNGQFLHRILTRLLFPRSLKWLLIALIDAGHFQIAKTGSI